MRPQRPAVCPDFLRGAQPQYKDPRPEYLVLDGQQRLSSLMYALTAPDLSLKHSNQRRWFFVNLDVLLEEPDNDEVVFDRAKRELRGLDMAEAQYKQRILPCTVLLDQHSFCTGYTGSRTGCARPLPGTLSHTARSGETLGRLPSPTSRPLRPRLLNFRPSRSRRVDRARMRHLREAQLDRRRPLGLRPADGASYRSDIRLHDLWKEAVAAHPRLKAWSKGKADEHKFGVLVLRTLALMRGLDPKPRILIDLQPDGFEADWRRAAAAIEKSP